MQGSKELWELISAMRQFLNLSEAVIEKDYYATFSPAACKSA